MPCSICNKSGHSIKNHASHEYSNIFRSLKERGDWKHLRFHGLSSLK